MTVNANVQPEYDKARKAVAAFQRIAPQLNAVARSITGNKKVRVVPGPGSYTDGTTITILPPLSMANKPKHLRGECSIMDFDGLSMCPACRSRSQLMSALMHEIHHIAFGSFVPLEMNRCLDLVECMNKPKMIDHYPASVIKDLSGIVRYTSPASMVALINKLGDQHLKKLYLFTEDVRINEMGWRVRPGVRAQAFAVEEAILKDGCEQPDGSIMHWSEAPFDAQVMAGILFATQGHGIDGYLDPEVCDLIHGDVVHPYLTSLRNAKDVYETATLTIELLADLRAAGYLIDLREDEDDSEMDSEEDPSESGDSAGDSDAPTESVDNDDVPDEPTGDEDDSKPRPPRAATAEELDAILDQLIGHTENIHASEADDQSGVAEAGDTLTEADEEKLSSLVKVMHLLDRVPRNFAGVVEYKRGEGEANGETSPYSYTRWNDQAWSPSESIVGKAVMAARITFSNNARVQHHRNERSGRIAGNVLGKRAALGDDRLFQRKTVPDKRNYHVMMGLDASYSMADGTMTEVKRAARALGDVCARTGVSFSIYAHSSGRNEDGDVVMEAYEIKAADEPWSNEIKAALQNIQPVNGNLDGHSIQYYRKKLDAIKATDKVLMYFTDGAMPAENHTEELHVLKSEIETFKRNRYTLLGVGLGTDSPTAHGLDTVRVDSESDYPKVIQHMAKVFLRRG